MASTTSHLSKHEAEIRRARWLLFAHRGAPVGRTVSLDGIPYRCTAPGEWSRMETVARRTAPAAAVPDGLRLAAAARKKRDAAPSWADLEALFGADGTVRDARGKRVGYRYPRYDDPEKNQKVVEQVYELWNPHRRASVETGAELNASVRTVELEDQAGRVRVVDERHAETVAHEQGLTTRTRHFTGGI